MHGERDTTLQNASKQTCMRVERVMSTRPIRMASVAPQIGPASRIQEDVDPFTAGVPS